MCNHVYDDMVHSEQYTGVCTKCGGESRRLVSTPRLDPRMGLDPDGFPTMGDRWAQRHEQARRIDEAREREHGPDAWGANGADVRR